MIDQYHIRPQHGQEPQQFLLVARHTHDTHPRLIGEDVLQADDRKITVVGE